MSRWFRLYDDTLNDPKILKLSDKSYRIWIGILCVASKNNGALPPFDDIALMLRMKPEKLQPELEKLIAVGLIDHDDDGLRPHNWEGRQYKSDVSTDRVKRFRNGKRNVSETPPDTEQNTEAETERKIEPSLRSGAHDENVSREKKSRKAKPSKVPLPSDWIPPARSREIASELHIDVADQEGRFRDYLASNGVQYVDYDSAFCNFVRNAPKFNGVRGPPRSNQQPSYQDIASTLGARANAANESGYSSDPLPRAPVSQFDLIEPDRGPGHRRAG